MVALQCDGITRSPEDEDEAYYRYQIGSQMGLVGLAIARLLEAGVAAGVEAGMKAGAQVGSAQLGKEIYTTIHCNKFVVKYCQNHNFHINCVILTTCSTIYPDCVTVLFNFAVNNL